MNQVNIGSDNSLSLIRCHAIIETNAELLLIEPLGTKFIEILMKIQNFSFTKMHLKILFAKWRPFCLGGDQLPEPQMSKLLIHSSSDRIGAKSQWHQPKEPNIWKIILPRIGIQNVNSYYVYRWLRQRSSTRNTDLWIQTTLLPSALGTLIYEYKQHCCPLPSNTNSGTHFTNDFFQS